MRVADLEAINKATRQELKRADGPPPSGKCDYYGYIDVELPGCPPFVMFTNNDSPTVNYILRDGLFEPTSINLWIQLCKTASSVLDVGANVGIYSLTAAALRKDIAVHAFEANPYAYSRLRMHKELNRAANIEEHAFAVGHVDGMTSFRWFMKPNGNISSGGHIGKPGDTTRYQNITVPMYALDSLKLEDSLGTRPLMKIDVEGGELGVFRGMTNVLALKPDIILESFHQTYCDKINALILPLGYSVYRIYEDTGEIVPTSGLTACAVSEHETGFNQFMTVHPLPSL